MTAVCVHGRPPDRCAICLNAEPLPREALPPIPPALLARPHDDCDRRIADLEAALSARSHEAIVARDEAELAKGILRKIARSVVRYGGWISRTDSVIDLTDAEAALFDSLTKETTE